MCMNKAMYNETLAYFFTLVPHIFAFNISTYAYILSGYASTHKIHTVGGTHWPSLVPQLPGGMSIWDSGSKISSSVQFWTLQVSL